MYDELIYKLEELVCDRIKDTDDAMLVCDAINAINALIAYVRQIEELRKDGDYLQKTKMMTYGQATMTMPLPEPPKEG
jgi:hypothetical protein